MIVPTSPGATSFAPTEQPSETNLLMALAEMHKQGRFKTAGDVLKFTPPAKGAFDPRYIGTDNIKQFPAKKTPEPSPHHPLNLNLDQPES